jgi:hypothetical protein
MASEVRVVPWFLVALLLAACGGTSKSTSPKGSGGSAGNTASGGSGGSTGGSPSSGGKSTSGGSTSGGKGGSGDTGGSGGKGGAGGQSASGGTGGNTTGGTGGVSGSSGGGGSAGDAQAGEGGSGADPECVGDFIVMSDADLATLAAMNCDVLEGNLTIDQTPLTTLDTLFPNAPRQITGSLSIQSNSELTNLEGLGGLAVIENSLLIAGNPRLGDFGGLETLTHVGSDALANALNISSNDTLSSVSSLGNIVELKVNVTVAGNAVLTTLDGIKGLVATSSLTIVNGPALTTIGGFADLEDCGSCTFVGNPLLQSIELPSLARADYITITGLAGLTSLSFPSLGTVTSSFVIASNEVLTSLGNLDALMTVGALTIAGNPALPQCLVDELDERLMACNDSCGGNDTNAVCN